MCDEQIAQCERELEMLRQPNCIHPEYLNMVKCIDERRAEKITQEKTLLAYKMKGLEIRTIAERQQLHSQYIQEVREIRESTLSECNKQVYELQRGRRQLGNVEEVDYSFKFPEKRSEQIRQQAAYNLEVSILSGIAKHVGFPAAPEMGVARPSDIEDDLRAMKVSASSIGASKQLTRICRFPRAPPLPLPMFVHHTIARRPRTKPRRKNNSSNAPLGQTRTTPLITKPIITQSVPLDHRGHQTRITALQPANDVLTFMPPMAPLLRLKIPPPR